MKVKVIRAHNNRHGKVYEKTPGDEYSLPVGEAEMLIRSGLVEPACTDAALTPKVWPKK